MVLKNFSYEETIAQAKEDIKFLKEEVIPMLKTQKAFSLANVDLIATVFLNVGSRMNTFDKVVSTNQNLKPSVRGEARLIFNEYNSLIDEAFALMEEKE